MFRFFSLFLVFLRMFCCYPILFLGFFLDYRFGIFNWFARPSFQQSDLWFENFCTNLKWLVMNNVNLSSIKGEFKFWLLIVNSPYFFFNHFAVTPGFNVLIIWQDGVSEAGRAGGGEGLVTPLGRLLYGVLLVLGDMANNLQTEFSAIITNI